MGGISYSGPNCLSPIHKYQEYDCVCPMLPGTEPNMYKKSCLEKQKDKNNRYCFGGCNGHLFKDREGSATGKSKSGKSNAYEIPRSAQKKIIRMYNAGCTIDETAITLGVGRSTVSRYRREYRLANGAPDNLQGNPGISEENVKKIYKLLDEGYSRQKIGLELKISVSTVRKYAQKRRRNNE